MSVSSVTANATSAGNTQASAREPLPQPAPLASAETGKKAGTAAGESAGKNPEKPAAIQIAGEKYLSIQFDRESNRFVFMSIEKSTGKVLEQYPAEEALRQIAYFRDLTGLTLDTGA